MKIQLIIIGTSHQLQAGHISYSIEQQAKFRKLIEQTVKKYRVKFIAEEMSEDCLPSYGVTETIGKQVATKKVLHHQYVDLTDAERTTFKIDLVSLDQTRQSAKLTVVQAATLKKFVDEFRECAWLVRILDVNRWPTLFICGARHGPRVEHLFNCIGKHAVIEAVDYAP